MTSSASKPPEELVERVRLRTIYLDGAHNDRPAVHVTSMDSNGGQGLESNIADVTPGDSGGPLFGWWGGDPRICRGGERRRGIFVSLCNEA
jgi:hypothetical protein